METKTDSRYSRQQIIENKMVYRKDLMDIEYSKHCVERLEQRVSGSIKFLPKLVRVTENNISSGTSLDGVNINLATVRIEYKKDTWCFLVLNLVNKKVITVYFKKKGEKKIADNGMDVNNLTAIFKFNGGQLAMLCSNCSVIIKTGKDFSKEEKSACDGDFKLKLQFCSTECEKEFLKELVNKRLEND